MNTRSTKRFTLFVTLFFGFIGVASAATGSTDFDAIYNYLDSLIHGSGGKTLVLASIILGAIFSVGRMSPIPILGGIVFAIFLQYVPSIAVGILTATI
jgi:conjugal transfer pilus assembly protein TraA